MATSPPTSAFFGPILLAQQFDATLEFYRTALGLPFTGSSPYARCTSPKSTLAIADGRWWARVNGSENPVQGASSVSDVVVPVEVEDVDAASERLMAAGIKFLSVPTTRAPLGIRNVFLRDPDGRSVMLLAATDRGG